MVNMTRNSNVRTEQNIEILTSAELMKRHRKHIRDRRLRKGSDICGQILGAASDNSIIELFPDEIDMAI